MPTDLLRFFRGDFGALRNFWNANIFHPEPLTLAYSEHLFAQAVQILPVYALTGNIILSYNLLFLSTFVLSGLGMFLFVREITGSARAGFAAGSDLRVRAVPVAAVFAPPGDLLAMDAVRAVRSAPLFRDEAAASALVGAGAALVAQNLSNGYFLLFFAPFAVAYALYEIATRNALDRRRAYGAR